VTDADVVLGRIGAADFAGGCMPLDAAAASAAIAR
jgi:N-methylhydantoinase A